MARKHNAGEKPDTPTATDITLVEMQGQRIVAMSHASSREEESDFTCHRCFLALLKRSSELHTGSAGGGAIRVAGRQGKMGRCSDVV